MTPFRLMLQLTGLSQREAALFLDISISSVEKMNRGVMNAPGGIMRELRDLHTRQIYVARGNDVLIEPETDAAAQALGWPSVGAWSGMAALAVFAGAEIIA